MQTATVHISHQTTLQKVNSNIKRTNKQIWTPSAFFYGLQTSSALALMQMQIHSLLQNW